MLKIKDRKEYYKEWREKNHAHIQQYKKEYAKTHDSSFKKMQQKNKQLQQENQQLKEQIKDIDMWNKLYNEEFNKNRILEQNWKKLKEYIDKTKIKESEKSFGKRYGKTFTQAEIIVCNMVKDKMKELERGVSE